jgi:hypothetical protein
MGVSTHYPGTSAAWSVLRIGILHTWQQVLGTARVSEMPRRRGRRARVPLADVLAALTYNVVQGTGTLAQHFNQMCGTRWADSSWSDRRQRLPWDIFADLMRRVLQPLATAAHADAFWRGWRFLVLDGTPYSVPSSTQVRATRRKISSRRGRAAFAMMTATVLAELGVPNPVAAPLDAAANPSGRWRCSCSRPRRRRRSSHATASMAARRLRPTRWPQSLRNASIEGPFQLETLRARLMVFPKGIDPGHYEPPHDRPIVPRRRPARNCWVRIASGADS